MGGGDYVESEVKWNNKLPTRLVDPTSDFTTSHTISKAMDNDKAQMDTSQIQPLTTFLIRWPLLSHMVNEQKVLNPSPPLKGFFIEGPPGMPIKEEPRAANVKK